MITGWGSHHYDTMHWALEFENTGPSRIEGKGEFPPQDRIWNVHGAYDVTLAVSEKRGGQRLGQTQHRPQVLSVTRAGSG